MKSNKSSEDKVIKLIEREAKKNGLSKEQILDEFDIYYEALFYIKFHPYGRRLRQRLKKMRSQKKWEE